jgi:hypothetical protein
MYVVPKAAYFLRVRRERKKRTKEKEKMTPKWRDSKFQKHEIFFLLLLIHSPHNLLMMLSHGWEPGDEGSCD